MSKTCQVCQSPNAIMCLYAKAPGTPYKATERGDNPFYPVEEADLATNTCVDCFHELAAALRGQKFVAIRATAYHPPTATKKG